MFRKSAILQRGYFRFRRWNRNGYAAFCSMGRCVSIGALSKSVTEASVRKQGNIHLSNLTERMFLFFVPADDAESLNADPKNSCYFMPLQENSVPVNRDGYIRILTIFENLIRSRCRCIWSGF